MKVAVGIDIGGTNTVFGFVDQNGNVLAKESVKTKLFCTPETFADSLCKKINLHLNDHQDWDLIGIGIGAPNGNYYNGTIEFAPNLDWEGIVPLVDLFKKHIDTTVILTNDANAAAIGEMTFGIAKGEDNFLMVTLGTGLGSGFVANGELIYGHDGFAGELGHTTIEINGRPCGCGRKGCLETYASATGVLITAKELLKSNSDSVLNNYADEELSSKLIGEAAQKGDSLALEVFDFTAQKLAFGLANAIAITSPKMIVLYGGVSNAGDTLLTPLKKYLEENLLNIFQNKVSIVISELDGGNAAILGAGALVWKKKR